MIIPSIYVKFLYMNSRADLNGDDDEGDDEDSNEKGDDNESISKIKYLLQIGF